MKIGILTYHCVPNFGAQLQATSTVGFIKRMGHEAIVLNWYPQDLEDMYSRRITPEQIAAHNVYTNNVLPVTEICRSEEDLLRIITQLRLDAIVVGSDALFKYVPLKFRKRFSKKRFKYVSKNVISVERLEGNPFFGGFVEKLKYKIPVVAFSVSSQNCPYFDMNKEEKKEMKTAVSNFSLITVRDEWTKDMIESILGVPNIKVTPDPVFSFNENYYLQMPTKKEILNKYNLSDNYILLSFSKYHVSCAYLNSLAQEAVIRGFQPVAFPMPELLYSGGIEKQITLPLNPIEWYALIKYSSGYIGERMHPIVVCLHNVIPFFSFDEYGTTRNYFMGMRKKYIQESSKTYQILAKARLTKWLHSYRKEKKLPSVEYVYDQIIGFDFSTCAFFSKNCISLYSSTMQKIISSFN